MHRSMYNSIQYFTEKVIPKIENKREKFMENPTELGSIQKETGETVYLLDDTMRALIAPVPVPGKRTFGMTKEALYRHYENKL